MDAEKHTLENDDLPLKKAWVDPECVEVDIAGVTRLGTTNPAIDGLFDLS